MEVADDLHYRTFIDLKGLRNTPGESNVKTNFLFKRKGVCCMFSCLPSKGKCEWVELKPFADKLNEAFKSNYELTECLDVTTRNSKQPEVILTNQSPDKNDMPEKLVIERKKIVWPPNRIRDHYIEHEFMGNFIEALNPLYNDKKYILEIAGPPKCTKKEVDSLVSEIIIIILKNEGNIKSGRSIRATKPIPWAFGLFNEEDEYLYPTFHSGLMIVFTESEEVYTPENYQKARKEILSELKNHLQSASKKFLTYGTALKIVLLEFYSDFYLIDDDIKEMINELPCPDNIDQIWLAEPEWISDDEYIIMYRRIM